MAFDHLIGRTLDRYRIDSLLGEGGMGAVFKAHDLTLQRDVALKILHSRFASQPNFQERFLLEARTAALLDHPSIVQVFDFNRADTLLYIVMEFIPGPNLRQMLLELKKEGQWVVLDEAVQLVRSISLALDYAHRQGVLHRDLKPANIMLKPRPTEGLPYRPILTDLGLAKLLHGQPLTQEGTSMGTPAYMSPEQAMGQATDARSDVYALGILLYELCVGQPPFPARTTSEAIRYHCKETPPPPAAARPGLPPVLEQAILKCLEKKPEDRFPNAAAFARCLESALGTVTAVTAGPTEIDTGVSLMTRYEQSLLEPRGASILEEFETPSDLTEDRIQIMGRDKTIRSTSMPGKEITVGRGMENDLTIDDPLASRRHARITFDGVNYRVIDLNSTNGTFMENAKLLPGVAEIWTPDKGLRIGETWFRLVRKQKTSTPISPSEGEAVSLPTRSASPGGKVVVVLANPSLAVQAGSSVTFQATVINQSPVVDHFQVQVEGLPAEWLPSPPPPVRLMPGTEQQLPLTCLPPRVPASLAGNHPFKLRITSQNPPAQSAEVEGVLTVLPFRALSLVLHPQKQSSPRMGQFTLEAHNQGNIATTFTFDAQDPEEGCSYTFTPEETSIPPGQEQLLRLTVAPGKPLQSWAPKSYPFLITAVADGESAMSKQVRGEWEQSPPVFEISLRPQKQRSPERGTFKIILKNLDDSELPLLLEASDPEEACIFNFSTPRITLPGNTEKVVQVETRTKQPLAEPKNISFTLTARVVDSPLLSHECRGEWEALPTPVEIGLPEPIQSIAPPPAKQPARAKPFKPNRIGGCLVFLISFAVTLIGTFGAGELQMPASDYELPRVYAIMGIVFVGGLIYSFIQARKVWNRKK